MSELWRGDSLRERIERAQRATTKPREHKPVCICAEPFWSIYPPPCPAHPDRQIAEVTW